MVSGDMKIYESEKRNKVNCGNFKFGRHPLLTSGPFLLHKK